MLFASDKLGPMNCVRIVDITEFCDIAAQHLELRMTETWRAAAEGICSLDGQKRF